MRGLAGLVHALRSERDWLGGVLALLIAVYALMAISVGLSPHLARWCMGRFHLRPASFVAWAAYQLGPWMYNFENQVLVSEHPLRARELNAPEAPYWFINHQSARVFTFADHRPMLFAQPGEHYVYLRSRYRDEQVLSGFRVRVHDDAQPDRATVTRLGIRP